MYNIMSQAAGNNERIISAHLRIICALFAQEGTPTCDVGKEPKHSKNSDCTRRADYF
jgi:hypothetical protein